MMMKTFVSDKYKWLPFQRIFDQSILCARTTWYQALLDCIVVPPLCNNFVHQMKPLIELLMNILAKQ